MFLFSLYIIVFIELSREWKGHLISYVITVHALVFFDFLVISWSNPEIF